MKTRNSYIKPKIGMDYLEQEQNTRNGIRKPGIGKSLECEQKTWKRNKKSRKGIKNPEKDLQIGEKDEEAGKKE